MKSASASASGPRSSVSEARELVAQCSILGDEICTILENGGNNVENQWQLVWNIKRIIASAAITGDSQQFRRHIRS